MNNEFIIGLVLFFIDVFVIPIVVTILFTPEYEITHASKYRNRITADDFLYNTNENNNYGDRYSNHPKNW